MKVRIKKAVHSYQKTRDLSKSLALYYACNSLTNNYFEKHRRTINIRHNIIIREISRQIPQTIQKYESETYNCGEKPAYPEPIWVCWLQGYENMNDFIKRCIKSLFDHAGDHPVFFIENNNVSEYITIPEQIQRKREAGIINAPHYCDVIRLLLLKNYGGLWVDSDLFVSKQISEDFFAKSFVSEKNNHADIPFTESIGYISKGNWSVQVIGGWKNDGILSYACDGLIEYLEKCDNAINYYLFDYMIEIARRRLSGAGKAIKEGAVDNGRYRKLNQAMKAAMPAAIYEDCISDETTFNTLNWKNQYPLKTESGEDSVYARFLMNQPIDEDALHKNRL